jgi:hypothetical protein
MQRWHLNGSGYSNMMVYNGDNSEPSGSMAHRKFLHQLSNYELIKDYTARHHLINMTKLYVLNLDLNSFNAYIQTCCCVDGPRYATPTMHHEAAEEPLHNQQLHYWFSSPIHDMLLGCMKDELHSRFP